MNVDADKTRKEIRAALARLVTEGLVPYNVLEEGGLLLQLSVVRSRLKLDEDASEDEHADAYASALASVLSEAVESPEIGGKSRRVLECVLPLDKKYLGTTVKERRTAAGMRIKPGKEIGPGTIRTYYEPKALERLARTLWAMELEFRERESGIRDQAV